MLGNTGPFPSPIRNRPRAVIIALVCISNKIIATNITACPEKMICQSEYFMVSKPERSRPTVMPIK